MDATRKPDQTIREYVSNFESSYSLAKSNLGMAELPSLFLMWVLTENANISEQDKKLVLSGVDLDKPPEIYKSTKKALWKRLLSIVFSRSCSWNNPRSRIYSLLGKRKRIQHLPRKRKSKTKRRWSELWSRQIKPEAGWEEGQRQKGWACHDLWLLQNIPSSMERLQRQTRT